MIRKLRATPTAMGTKKLKSESRKHSSADRPTERETERDRKTERQTDSRLVVLVGQKTSLGEGSGSLQPTQGLQKRRRKKTKNLQEV